MSCPDRPRFSLSTPGKPNQNAHVESFNGRLRDECLNEHWFANLLHARAVIEPWHREYNEERPKKVLGGWMSLTPLAIAGKVSARTGAKVPSARHAPLNAINAGDEAQDFGGDLEGVGLNPGVQCDIQLHPFWCVIKQ